MGNTISFGLKARKVFSVDGDESRSFALDLTDTGILGRWHEMEDWFASADEKARDILSKADDENGIHDMSKAFYELDSEIKQKLNYLFDADVCTPVVGNGAIIRAVEGQPLFTIIISNLLPLYEKEIENENKKAQARIAKHTAKYTKPEK